MRMMNINRLAATEFRAIQARGPVMSTPGLPS
jgi:hypothetical protein